MSIDKNTIMKFININYNDYKHPDGSIDHVSIKNYTINNNPYYDENDPCSHIKFDHMNDFMYFYNVNESMVEKCIQSFQNVIMTHQRISDKVIINNYKYINWNLFLKYNLLSKELLDKIHMHIGKNILLTDIDYKNKILLRDSKYEFNYKQFVK